MTPRDGVTTKRIKALDYARRYGLSREDRLELAEVLLRRDVASWKDLDEAELVRLLDALEGFALVHHLMLTRETARLDGTRRAVSVPPTDGSQIR